MTAQARYDAVAIVLHWLVALGILALVVIGLSMTHGNFGLASKFRLYQLHKSIGITVLLAAILRLAWRLTHRPPPLPVTMPPLERKAADGVHLALYAFLFFLPLTGWALVSASPLNLPTVLYGVVPWPHLPMLADLENKAPLEHVLKLIHGKGAWLLIALFAVHLGAALRHQFILRDGILRRMLPIGCDRSGGSQL
ncbi:MAG: cytochrome [Rhodospirillales bacterium]|nr:cytochrome [Rhodospirillales bacterium]